MGDANNDDLRVSFDSRLKLKFLGSQVTTDAGRRRVRNFNIRVRPRKQEPDLFYVNKYMALIEAEMFA